MKPEDLRIGNTIYTKLGGGEWRPCNLVYEDFQFIIIPNQKVYKPIPLTDKKLIEFGFIKNEGNIFENIILPYWVKDSVLLFFNTGQEEYSWKIGYGEMNLGKYFAVTFRWINEVHLLQNIYYDLTGKELVNETIKA